MALRRLKTAYWMAGFRHSTTYAWKDRGEEELGEEEEEKEGRRRRGGGGDGREQYQRVEINWGNAFGYNRRERGRLGRRGGG